MPDRTSSRPCADCRTPDGTLEIRKRQLCQYDPFAPLEQRPDLSSACFIKYVNSKVIKRMESYRFKNTPDELPRKLLLPVSCGVSSTVLLQILDSQLHRQLAGRNRTAYELHVLFVDIPNADANASTPDVLRQQKSIFSSHTFHYVSLSEVFIRDPEAGFALAQLRFPEQEREPPQTTLDRLMAAITTSTSYTEIQDVLLIRLIVAVARAQNCESILWGHSDSRLAARALSAVARGRGASLATEISDGPSAWGLLFNYPMRDLFQPEIALYASLLPDRFIGLFAPESRTSSTKVSSRDTSIDHLLTSYIALQGEKYPGIMANVVRTVSKLRNGQDARRCIWCRSPSQSSGLSEKYPGICYGCVRTSDDLTTAP